MDEKDGLKSVNGLMCKKIKNKSQTKKYEQKRFMQPSRSYLSVHEVFSTN